MTFFKKKILNIKIYLKNGLNNEDGKSYHADKILIT